MLRPALFSLLLGAVGVPASFAASPQEADGEKLTRETLTRVVQPVLEQIVADDQGRPWRMEIRPTVTLSQAQAEADAAAENDAPGLLASEASADVPPVPSSTEPVPAPVDATMPQPMPAPTAEPTRDASSVTIRPRGTEASKAAAVYRETLRALPYSRQMNTIRPGYRSELAVLITTGKTLPPVAQPGGFGDAGGFAPPYGFGGTPGFGTGRNFGRLGPRGGGYIPAQWDYYQSYPPVFRTLNPYLYGF